MAFELSVAELQSFHSIDRELFTRLVTELGHNRIEAMRVVALWLWAEEMGYPSVVLSLRNMPGVLVNAAFAEAVSVLECMENGNPPPQTPLTSILMFQALNLQAIYHNRLFALSGVNRIMEQVCFRAFRSINQEQQVIFAHSGTSPTEARAPEVPSGLLGHADSNAQPLPSLDGVASQGAGVEEAQHEAGQTSTEAESGDNKEELPLESRTMFFTFSKGYHVTEEELLAYFQSKYGDVIEGIYMDDTPPDTQPLWARVVFRSPDTVDSILAGREKVKFVVEQKHVMCRRFIPRK